jgi:hypothetical protein
MDEVDIAAQRSRMDEFTNWWAFCPKCQKQVRGTVSQLQSHGERCDGL